MYQMEQKNADIMNAKNVGIDSLITDDGEDSMSRL